MVHCYFLVYFDLRLWKILVGRRDDPTSSLKLDFEHHDASMRATIMPSSAALLIYGIASSKEVMYSCSCCISWQGLVLVNMVYHELKFYPEKKTISKHDLEDTFTGASYTSDFSWLKEGWIWSQSLGKVSIHPATSHKVPEDSSLAAPVLLLKQDGTDNFVLEGQCTAVFLILLMLRVSWSWHAFVWSPRIEVSFHARK